MYKVHNQGQGDTMKEPDIESQLKEADRKRLAGEITKEQYIKLLDSISHQYDEYLRRSK
jgi:hypothetical protein